jgi:hypothetical protein
MGYPAPPMGYPAPGYAPMPLQGSAPNMATSERPDSFAFAGMRLTRQHDDDAYTLDIQLNGLDPAQVRVLPAGHALAIIATRSAQTEREERFADGRGFQPQLQLVQRSQHEAPAGAARRRTFPQCGARTATTDPYRHPPYSSGSADGETLHAIGHASDPGP